MNGNTDYNYNSITQQYYTYSEIETSSPAQTIPDGSISKLTFIEDGTTVKNYKYNKFVTIYMKHTSALSVVTSWDMTWKEEDIVYQGIPELKNGTLEFILTKPFDYDKKNDILIFFDADKGEIDANTTTTEDIKFALFTTNTNKQSAYGVSTSTNFNPLDKDTYPRFTARNVKNVITFTFSSGDAGGDDTDEPTIIYPEKPALKTPINNVTYQFFPELNFTLGKNTTHYQILYKSNSDNDFTSVTGDSWIEKGNNYDVSYILNNLSYSNNKANIYNWKVIARNQNDPSDATKAVITSSDTLTFRTAEVYSPSVSSSYNEETKTTTISWTHSTIRNESGQADGTITYNVYVNGSKVKNTTAQSYEIDPSSLNIGNNTIEVSVVKGANESAKSEINIELIVYGKVSGQTIDDTSNALQDVIVTFTNSNIDEPYTFTTNEEGMFSSDEILLGNYTVTFEKYGYNTIEQTVEITDTENVTSIGVISMSPAIAIYDNDDWNMEPENKDVIIKANATIDYELTVKSITIEENASLTLDAGANLTVIGKLTNTDAASLIIKDGAQLFQKNENVPATFIMDITRPTEWDDSKNITGWQFISSPFTNASITNFTENIEGDYDLYKYDRDKIKWVNHKVKENAFEKVFASGRGYLASYQSEETAEITGILNNNTTFSVNLPFAWSDPLLKYFHLLGNPFPFDIDLTKAEYYHLIAGAAIVNENGGYTYVGTGNEQTTIPVGDGFFVKATGDNPSLSYTHNARSSQEKANSINVIASGKAGKDNVVIRFAGQAEGFDKLQNFNDAIATIYVTENGKNYGIANVDENTTEVTLNFSAKEMGSYTISFDVNGEFETVTLVDRFTGIETNMLIEDEYNFVATSKDMKNRFVVRLTNGQEPTANSQFVYQNGEELILSIEGSVQIVDMLGRVVYSNEHADAYNRINVAEFKDATYVVRVVNEEGVKVQKVVIY